MNHAELKEAIIKARQPGHCFIKWWGNDKALVDYELLERFLKICDSIPEVAGFELYDLNGIWQVLVELDPDPLSREQVGDREMIQWRWSDRQGKQHLTTFPYTPEGVMELMESEFFD
jgi:hypothetical protein